MILKKPRWSLSVYFIIIGMIFLAGAGYHSWKTINFYLIKNSSEAEATIAYIETNESINADSHNVYVSFVLGNGELHTSILDTYVEGMKVGNTVKIIYDKDNPDEIILWWSSPLLMIIFSGIGLFIIIVTMIIRHTKKRNNPAK